MICVVDDTAKLSQVHLKSILSLITTSKNLPDEKERDTESIWEKI